MQSSQSNKLQNYIKLVKTWKITKKRTLAHHISKQHMHYKRVKHIKYENPYTYIVKLSGIKYTKKMEHNIKCLLLADYHDQ